MKTCLSKLIGRTVMGIQIAEYDCFGDSQCVREVYKITCKDGFQLLFACDGGDGPFYATIQEVQLNDLLRSGGKFLTSFKVIRRQ